MERIKVFLVEDEIVIRDGIRKSINWEKEGYDFTGEASDGELAYPKILKATPDILITDIKMPFMDGLELSRLVRKELPDIKILILSGYDEFEYAKTAIKIGVTEYLLKPITAVKLLEVLGQVSETIRREKEEKQLLTRYSEEMRENIEHEKMKLFGQLVQGEMSMNEVLDAGEKYSMKLIAPCYRILLFKILSMRGNCEKPERLVEACEKVDGLASQESMVYEFQRGVEGLAFLFTSEDEESMEELSRRFMDKLCETMKDYAELDYFGGIGSVVLRIRNLNESFKEAEKAFAARFTNETNRIVSIREVQSVDADDGLSVKNVVEIGKSRGMLEKFLNNGTVEETEAFSHAYLERMERDNLRSALVRQYIVMDIYVAIMAFCEKFQDSETKLKAEAEELQSAFASIHSIEELRKYLIMMLKEAIELRDRVSGRRYSDLIEAAKKEIEETYMSEDISLNQVAVCVGMSPSYFSAVFSKEMGKTFVEYLTEIRMEKAKELLMCSAMKTSEIGFEVGYKDPHYFSYIFKKTQGISPKDYRARRKEV